LNIKYSNKIDSLSKIIEDLQNKINNKNNETKPKCRIDKSSSEYIYNSIFIYEDVKLPYQKYRASKTYRKLLEEIEFNNKIGDNSYDDITNWINNNEKTNFKSTYFKNKYNRSKLIIEKYKDNLYKLNNLKFSISYISNMPENKFNNWLNILEDKFNSYYKNNIDDISKKDENLDSRCKENIENEELNFPCKNRNICDEEVSIRNIFCDSCKNDLKNCKKCKEEFWTDDNDIKYCEDCGNYDNEEEEEDYE
jgi:hypothetical protein